MTPDDPVAVSLATCLAQAGYLFSIGQLEKDQLVWTLNFNPEPPHNRRAAVHILVADPWVRVTTFLGDVPADDVRARAQQLLEINGELILAKIGVIRGDAVVWTCFEKTMTSA